LLVVVEVLVVLVVEVELEDIEHLFQEELQLV
jgi:hypothetical protein